MNPEIKARLRSLELWLAGLWSAFVMGGSTAILASLGVTGANAAGVNIASFSLKQVGAIGLSGALVRLLQYVSTKPLPGGPVTLIAACLIPFLGLGCASTSQPAPTVNVAQTEAWITANVIPGLPGVIAGGVVLTAQAVIKDDGERQQAAAECYAIAKLVRSTMGARLPDSEEFRKAIESAGGGGPFLDFTALADMAGGYVNPYLEKLAGDGNVKFVLSFIEAVASGFEKGAAIILKQSQGNVVAFNPHWQRGVTGTANPYGD